MPIDATGPAAERALESDVELGERVGPIPSAAFRRSSRRGACVDAVDDVDVRRTVTELDAADAHRARAEVDGDDGDAHTRGVRARWPRSPRRVPPPPRRGSRCGGTW